MVDFYTEQNTGELTLEALLEHEALSGQKTVFRQAFAAMLKQSSKDHEPGYVSMVLETSEIILNDMGLGSDSVKCLFLKNVYDHGSVPAEEFVMTYGEKVRDLIEGIRKIERLDTQKYLTNQENLIHLMVTLTDDIRVPLIRLGMRLYDIRHLSAYDYIKQCQVVGETKALYIPIAHRLGLYRIKNEMEDKVMRFSDPKTYDLIAQKLRETEADRDHYTNDFIGPIARILQENGLECEIKSRIKSIPSIRRKMKVQKVEFEKVYDLFAIRIILDNTVENEVADCWKIYSLVTHIYTPNPRRLRDWISFPKSTGYESLHTTVVGPEGRWVEVQIRTRRMDEIAEKGYAAHWKYKSDGKQEVKPDLFASIRELLEKPAGVSLEKAITQEKKSLYSEDIFIFTPKGDLKKLKSGYSVLDFAYEIHTDVGASCTGAIINGRMVPLKHTLHNGDTVKIITAKNQKPNQRWLDIAKSPRAIAKIKHALKMETYRESEWGKEMLRNKITQLGFEFTDPVIKKVSDYFGCGENILELYQLFGEGKGELSKVKKALAEADEPVVTMKEESLMESLPDVMAGREGFVIIDPRIKSLHYQYARCCNPAPGDSIFAFVSINQGIKIHKTTCSNAREMVTRYPYRILEARWRSGEPEAKAHKPHPVKRKSVG